MASSGSGYMKIRLAIGAHDQRNMLQPPASRNTPISAGTNVYMSSVTMRKLAHHSRITKLNSSSPTPAARADVVTSPTGFRHQKSSSTVNTGTIQPCWYCGLSQNEGSCARLGQ